MYTIDLKLNVRLGVGAIATLPAELGALGIERPILLTDPGVAGCGVLDRVRSAFPGNQPPAVHDTVPENPTLAGVADAVRAVEAAGADGIVGLGGGSVIDTAKAVAVAIGHGRAADHFLGHPERIGPTVAPLVAVPTTAGTGSEVSMGAGIHAQANVRALAIRSPHCRPRLALCDPALTVTLPPHLTASTGIDAMTHCLEGVLSANDNPVAEAVALDGISRVMTNLQRAVADGHDLEAREQMMIAALAGGVALSMGAGPAHAIANTLGDQDFNHGLLVTLAMPAVLRWQGRHQPGALERIGMAMGLAPKHQSGDGVAAALDELIHKVGLPSGYRIMGYRFDDLDEIVDDAANSFFNAACRVRPSADDYRTMIDQAMG